MACVFRGLSIRTVSALIEIFSPIAFGLLIGPAMPARAEEPTLVIERCAVFDPLRGEMLPDRTIVVRGEEITALLGPEESAKVPAGGTRIDGHQFEADLSAWGLFKVYLINLLGIIFTLGLFIPWAKVNIARYMADHVYLIPHGDLDRFVADQQSAVAAVGEEMGEMFDIDIGL